MHKCYDKEWDKAMHEKDMEMPYGKPCGAPCGMPYMPCMMGPQTMHMHMPMHMMHTMEQMPMMPCMQMPAMEQMPMMPCMQMPMMEQMPMMPYMQMPAMEQMPMMPCMQMPMMEQMPMMPYMQMPAMEQMPMMPYIGQMPEMYAGEMKEMYADDDDEDYDDPSAMYLEELEKEYPDLSCEAKMVLKQLMEVDFVILEFNLYLDTHPTDQRALGMRNRYVCMREPLVKRLQALYGPLTNMEQICYPWRWLNQPWPWRIKF